MDASLSSVTNHASPRADDGSEIGVNEEDLVLGSNSCMLCCVVVSCIEDYITSGLK